MAKAKIVKQGAERGKDIKSKADEKRFQKMQTAFKKEVLGMNLEDLKKTFLESTEAIEQSILETVKWNANQRDLFVKIFGKEIKKINDKLNIAEKNFQTLDRRLHDLEAFTTIMAIKSKEVLQRKPMTFEERKDLAACVSIKWGKGEEKAFNASMH